MKQNKIPKNEYIIQPKGKTNPYKYDVDYRSKMGYRDDSPYNQNVYNDIYTPNGMIDMSATGIPLMANGQYLPPYSGIHNMGTPYVTEERIAKYGGWLDQYQGSVGGNQVPKSKPKIDFEGSRRTSSNSFPTSKIEAEEMLAEQRKPGYKKPDLTEYYREKAYRNKEEETVNTHVPQSTLSKGIEIASNPGLALKNYRGGRLPDYFSSNQEVDMADPLNVMNMGYQWLTPLGKAAYTLQSADDVYRDLENEDYVSAGIDAAFVLPGLGSFKKTLSGLLNRTPAVIPTIGAAGVLGAAALQEEEDGGFLEDKYRRGGQKRKKYTSKNIQSSVNDLFKRNETLFGPAGRKNYKPGLKYKSGGGWLDNLH